MAWKPIADRIATLPLVIAGPILRRVEKDNVSVWLALKEPCLAEDNKQLRLEIYDNGTSTSKGALVMSGGRDTVSLGEHLHIVVLTAKTSGTLLQSGHTYSYNVKGNGVDFTNDPALCYLGAGFTLPTFSLPPADLNQLRIIHASCRKLHAQGTDALADVDRMLLDASSNHITMPLKRPHQLFLTGDQIYADDVDGLLLFLIRDICDGADATLDVDAPTPRTVAPNLLNWSEVLRIGTRYDGNQGIALGSKLANAPRYEGMLEVGRRHELLEAASGLHFPGEWEVAKNHLIKLGEYYGMYLLMWSPLLWPLDGEYPSYRNIYSKKYFPGNDNPGLAPVGPDEVVAENSAESGDDKFDYTTFARSVTRAKLYQDELWAIRRSMANIPTYMICDDHEVTDDWFLDYHWCETVLPSALGHRILQNGLTAYTLFQGWGNIPAQFEEPMGQRLLETMPHWQDIVAYENSVEPYLTTSGIHDSWRTMAIITGMPALYETLSQHKLVAQHPDRLRHHYYIAWEKHEVLVLDTRTARDYPGTNNDYAALISRESLGGQLGEFSRQNGTIEVTFIVIATPISGIPHVEDDLTGIARRASRFKIGSASTEGDFTGASAVNYFTDAEGYAYQQKGLQDLYAGIGRSVSGRQRYMPGAVPGRIVVLSGDLHYGFTNRVEFWAERFADMLPTADSLGTTHFVLAQLCASALKNEKDDYPFPRVFESEFFSATGTYGYNSVDEVGYSADEILRPFVWLGWIAPAQGIRKVGNWDYATLSPSSVKPIEVTYLKPVVRINERMSKAGVDLTPNIDAASPPDWMYRISYVKALKPPVNPQQVLAVSSPTTGTTATYQQRADALKNYLAATNNNKRYLLKDSAGSEAVGKNNLGEVTFDWGSTEQTKFVRHYLWWSKANGDGTDAPREPHSKFAVLLGKDDNIYPRPTRPYLN